MQCFVIRPHDFDEKKKYPWVFMPHGGPVSSWTDSWSTRVGRSLKRKLVMTLLTGVVEYGRLGRAGLCDCLPEH